MKTKTTQIMKTQLTIAFWSIVMLFSFAVHSQTHIYNEGASSGITFTNNGSQVTNPVSDAVNSSANCAQSGTVAVGEGIHYLPSGGYTPVAGARLYFSVYNPGNTMYGQVKFEYSGAPNVLNNGGDIYYVPGSVSGWVEYSISLTPNLGNTISKILLYPSGSSAVAVFVDNIYFHTTSIYPTSGATHFFKDAVEHGSIFNSGVTIVNNPLSNAINSSAKCLKTNGTGAWRETQINAVRYVIKTGDNMFISFYNPNNAVLWQLRFDFHDGEYIGPTDIEHVSAAASGWNEVSVDLTPYIGREIKQIKVLAAHSELKVVNYDNIYISNTSVLSTNSVTQINDQVSVSKEGQIQFNKEQTNTNVSVFDIAGRLIFDEKINGVKGEKALNQKGIYILKVKSEKGVSSQKVIF
jgi:hypothetical protein